MYIVILTALGVGGATVIGALIGFLFKDVSRRFSDIILSFAAGIMLCASVVSLILPSLENGGKYGIITTLVGILLGVLSLHALDILVSRLCKRGGEYEGEEKKRRSVLLFVLAIAIHNMPEGIAAGVGFGTGSISDALLIAGAIALQNLPEGMVIVNPMLSVGIRPGRAFFLATLTGLVEVFGAFLGYFAISVFSALLPFSLAFAGGTMLYIIIDEIIPTTRIYGRSATYSLIFGFMLMLLLSSVMG